MHLLLLHGAIGAADQLKPLAAALEKDFTVHTLDFPGHGSRSFPDKPYSISLFADDVLAYIDILGVEKVAVFGYSMGGYVGMYLALHHPSCIYKLATLATKFHWDAPTAQREIQMLNPEKILQKVPALAQALTHRHHPKDWKVVLERTASLLKGLGETPPLSPDLCSTITVATLLLLGDRDKMVGLDETLAIYKSIAGAQLGVLPGTPHPIEQVNTSMLAFQLRRFYTN